MQVLEKNWHLVEEATEKFKELKPCKIILFGSYASGNPTEDSDLDVAVILDSEKIVDNYRERMDRYLKVSSSVRAINYQIAMDIIVYSKAEFEYLKEQKNDFVEEIETVGKILYEK
jgi:predicted nucleotidyltransferase